MSSRAVARVAVALTVSPFNRRCWRQRGGTCPMPVGLPPTVARHSSMRSSSHERFTAPMTKSIDAITEIVKNPKHSFRKADDRPVKAQKHRYERRKVKEYIKLGNWGQEAPA